MLEDSTNYVLENIDLNNLELLQEAWIKGTDVRIGTYKIQLPGAIGNVGNYYYRLVMKNNAYFGCDVDIPIDLEVTPVSIGKSLAGLKRSLTKRTSQKTANLIVIFQIQKKTV